MEQIQTNRPALQLIRLVRNLMRKRVMLLPIAGAAWAFLLVLGPAGCSDSECNGPSDIKAPRVESIYPVEGEVDIPTDTVVTATFSEEMDPATISAGSFTLEGPNGPIAATVSLNGLTATLTPSVRLGGHSLYTARIDAGVTDLAGNEMGVPYAWSFTTGTTNLILYPDIEFTVRDTNKDDVPDSLFGGGPPGRFLMAGETQTYTDRAVWEFPLGEIVHDSVLEAIIFFTISESTIQHSDAHVEAWGFSGDGHADLSDWSNGFLIAMYDSLEISTGNTYAFSMTGAINSALDAGATHVGFRLVVTGEPYIEIATTDNPTAYDGAKIVIIY
jgi:hypothetical protein